MGERVQIVISIMVIWNIISVTCALKFGIVKFLSWIEISLQLKMMLTNLIILAQDMKFLKSIIYIIYKMKLTWMIKSWEKNGCGSNNFCFSRILSNFIAVQSSLLDL